MKTITLIAIVGLAVIGFMVWNSKKANAKQPESNVSPNTTKSTSAGSPEGKAEGNTSATHVKRNIITSNLVTEDLLRKLDNSRSGGQNLEVFRDENFTISLKDAFKPIGDADVTNPLSAKGAKLPKGFVGRKVQTFKIETKNAKTGTIKERIGSAGLVKRLQENYARNSAGA